MRQILSYPKSGRTWIRFMLDSYLCGLHGLDCENVFRVETLLQDDYPVEWTHLTAAMVKRLPYHRAGCFDRSSLRRSTVILITRDILPTLASAYHQAVHRAKVFQGTPSEFMRDGRYGVLKIATFYNIWGELEHRFKSATVVKYERMLLDPVGEFKRILGALGIEANDEGVGVAIQEASFENMKRLSKSEAYRGSVIAPRDPDDPKSQKVRVGGNSGYHSLFAKSDLEYARRVFNDVCHAADALGLRISDEALQAA